MVPPFTVTSTLLRPESLLQLLVEPPTRCCFVARSLWGVCETCRGLYDVRWLRFYCIAPPRLSILYHDIYISELFHLYIGGEGVFGLT
jgi:hypothetical protein